MNKEKVYISLILILSIGLFVGWKSQLTDGPVPTQNGLISDVQNLKDLVTKLEKKLYDDEIGTIKIYSAKLNDLPAGWKRCDGSKISKKEHKLAYVKLKDIWGVSTDEYCQLPDLRGQFIRGAVTEKEKDKVKIRLEGKGKLVLIDPDCGERFYVTAPRINWPRRSGN